MKTNLEKEANNIVKVNIEIPAKDAVTEYNKAASAIANHVNIPGFRKGKAPRNIVEKHVGEDKIKHEALERLLPKIFRDVITENNLDVVSQPYVESYDYNVGEDLKLVAKIELRPEVTLGKYKDLKIEIEDHIIPEDAHQKALDGLLQNFVTTNLVVDRASKNTDLVLIDFDGSVNGEKIQGGAAENYTLDLANSNFIPGFAEQLVGKKLGSEFDIKVDFPKDYHEAKLAGQPAIFKIKLKEIKEKVMPEVNDEFAQKAGPFKTVEELNADIEKYLATTKERENSKNAEIAIFNKVIEGIKVDIQETMVERETQTLLEEYKQKLSAQGFNWEEAFKAQGSTLMDSVKEEALLRIKNALVIDKIAQVEDLKVEPADLDLKIKELETTYHINRAEVMKQLQQNPGIINSISHQALNEKVIKFLKENNKVEFKTATKAKAKAAAKAKTEK